MTTRDRLLDKLLRLPEPKPDVAISPPIELVAFVVRWNRDLRNWKTTTLAEYVFRLAKVTPLSG